MLVIEDREIRELRPLLPQIQHMSKSDPKSVLDGLHFSQDQLEPLCREPTLSIPELTGMNTGFGMGSIMRCYASLPDDEPLTFGADHGVPLNPEAKFALDFEHGLPGYLAPYEQRVEFLRKAGKVRVLASAMPLHYARKSMERRGIWSPPTKRRGTLVFPTKSSDMVDRSFNSNALATWVTALPEKFQPVCVCIYWKDFLKDRHRAFLEAGLPVVTCGHYASPDFLPRLIDLCTRFEYSCSNDVSGSCSLSVACGCQFFFKDVGAVEQMNFDGSHQIMTNIGAESKFGAKLFELAQFPPRPDSRNEQRRLAEFLTGANHLLAPEEIRALQQWGKEWLLDHQPDQVSFVEDVPLSDLNTWIPIHVRKDGWAGPDFRIVLKPRSERAKFTLYFKLSPKICAGPLPLTVQVDSDRPTVFQCAVERYQLTLPVPAKRETIVKIALPAEIAAVEKARKSKALRILGWRVGLNEAGKPACEQVSRNRLPPFVAVPRGW